MFHICSHAAACQANELGRVDEFWREQGRRFRSLLRRARVHELHGASPSDVRLHRRARACVGGRSKGGQEGQALGRSRGGFTTKIHAKSDASGDIIAFDLTGGDPKALAFAHGQKQSRLIAAPITRVSNRAAATFNTVQLGYAVLSTSAALNPARTGCLLLDSVEVPALRFNDVDVQVRNIDVTRAQTLGQ
jgi:hypothetical protein